MRARRIIQNGAFEPEEIAFLDDVFAASWKQIEDRFPDTGEACDAARERLASIIVTLAKCRDTNEASVLQKEAIEVFDQNKGFAG
jgi:hypothetical protein